MVPLDIIGLINLALAGYLIFALLNKKDGTEKILEAFKHLGGLAVAWGSFSTLAGLFFAFGALEEAQDTIPFAMICGGLKVALISVLYGLIIYILTLLAYIGLRMAQSKPSALR